LPGFGSGWDITQPIRLWMYVSAQNAAANSDNSILAVDNAVASNFGEALYRGFNAGTAAMTLRNMFLSTNTDATNDETLGASNAVHVIVMRGGAGDLTQGFFGAIGGGDAWPSPSALQILGQISPGSAVFTSTGARAGVNMDFTNWGLTIGAMRAGSGTSYNVTIKKVRIDYIVS